VVDQVFFIKMLRERQLAQDAVDLGVFVEFLYQGDEVFLGGVFRQVISFRINAEFFGGLFFLSDVYLGSRVRADEDGYQAGYYALHCAWL